MIDLFCDWFEGTWENKVQAFSYPAKYAMIRLVHTKVPGTQSMFYGEQAYNYSLNVPYRQFVIEVTQDGDALRIRNYEFPKESYRGFKNLDQLKYDEDLTHKVNCDTIFRFDGNAFRGLNEGCSCYVDWQDQVTYVSSEIFMTEDKYHVIDKGYLVETDKQVWGGRYGPFNFVKTPAPVAQG